MTDLDRIREVLLAHADDGKFLLAVAYLAADSMTSDERGKLKYALNTMAGNTGPREKVHHKDDSPLPVRVRRTSVE